MSQAIMAPDELAQEYVLCSQDAAYFLNSYGKILDPNLGQLDFKLWAYQEHVLRQIERNQLLVILKARQLGISWLMAGLALWTTAFHDGAVVLMISYRLEDAMVLLDKVQYMYDQLPAWLQPSVGKRNETTLQFKRRNSKVVVLPSTMDAGRGEAATLVIVDEVASHPYAAENYVAYKPTIDAGGKLVLLGTAKGRGNFLHQIWTSEDGSFTRVFLPANLRPGRDDVWMETKRQEYQIAGKLREWSQEYPVLAVDAFIASSGCRFNIDKVKQMLQQCKPPLETRLNGALKIWKPPLIGRRYVAGADVAEGLSQDRNLDSSGMAVYDWQTLEHVADLHGKWPADVFAKHCYDLGMEYGGALLAVERNNHGLAVIINLQQLGYPRLYRHVDLEQQLKTRAAKTIPKLGWPTNVKTRPLMEATLERYIESFNFVSYDEAFFDEVLSYVYLGTGRAGASAGCHDDRVVKHAIALCVHGSPQASRGIGGAIEDRYVVGQFEVGL